MGGPRHVRVDRGAPVADTGGPHDGAQVADLYLDDAPHQVRAIHRHRPEAATVRFVRAWNDPIPGVHDVQSWEEFVALVEAVESGPRG